MNVGTELYGTLKSIITYRIDYGGRLLFFEFLNFPYLLYTHFVASDTIKSVPKKVCEWRK